MGPNAERWVQKLWMWSARVHDSRTCYVLHFHSLFSVFCLLLCFARYFFISSTSSLFILLFLFTSPSPQSCSVCAPLLNLLLLCRLSPPSTWLWPETTVQSVCVVTAGLRTPWTTATTPCPAPFTLGKNSRTFASDQHAQTYSILHRQIQNLKVDPHPHPRVNIQQSLQHRCRHGAALWGFCSAATVHISSQHKPMSNS